MIYKPALILKPRRGFFECYNESVLTVYQN